MSLQPNNIYKPPSKTSIISVSQMSNSNSSINGAQNEDIQVLTSTKSEYNEIKIVESSNSKILYLEDSGRVHSILYKSEKWTNSYWDEFTSLPAIIPPGPIAVFGLGGGTIVHQLLHFWPSLCLHGWELDEVLIDKARELMGLSELEKANSYGGILKVHVGDALSPLASIEGGFAGIVVDLFAGITMLPELEKAETWLEMKEKLMPNGRIMVNCGRASRGGETFSNNGKVWEENLTVQAMCEAFGMKFVNWKKFSKHVVCRNYLAFTGPYPDIDTWFNAVPEKLGDAVALWRSCDL